MDLQLTVGGNTEVGVISYIENYGFYEGGKGVNPFRIGKDIKSRMYSELPYILILPYSEFT